MNLGEEYKIMHDPKALLENHFVHQHTKITYAQEDVPDDSIYRGVIHSQRCYLFIIGGE